MKKRRLLALVLCFAMIFGDMTNTFASTLSDTPVVVTDTEAVEVITETETVGTENVDDTETVQSTETVEGTENVEDTESVEGTETVEGTEEVETTETVEDTEIVGTTETVEDTEEVEDTEVVEETTETEEVLPEILPGEQELEPVGEGESNFVEVGYHSDEGFVRIGSGSDIKTAMAVAEAFLADEANAGFAGTIQISLNADVKMSDEENDEFGSLALEHDSAYICLNLNGHTLTLTADTYMRANIESYSGIGTIAAGSYTLTMLPTSQAGEGTTHTNVHDIQITFGETEAAGKLIVGESWSNDALVDRELNLNNVSIVNVNDVVFQGKVSYNYDDNDANTTELVVGNSILVETSSDERIHQEVHIRTSMEAPNVTWNASGDITNLNVTDTLTVSVNSYINVRNSLNVNNIHVTGNGDPNLWVTIRLNTFLNGDSNNALISKPSFTISGAITTNEEINCPIGIEKDYVTLSQMTNEWGDTWINEYHNNGIDFAEGEVVVTLGENSTVEADAFNLFQWESGSQVLAKKVNNQIVASAVAAEVCARIWNEEEQDWNEVGRKKYTSFTDAVAGIASDFADVTGRFDVTLFDDITLSESITFPENAVEVNMCSAGMRIEEFDENGYFVNGYDHHVRRTVNFNGYTMTVHGNVDWQETLQMAGNGKAGSALVLVPSEDETRCFRWHSVWSEESFGKADGSVIDRASVTNTITDGVAINNPGGPVEFNAGNVGYKYNVNANILGGCVRFGSSDFTVKSMELNNPNEGSFVGENGSLKVTGTTTVTAGSCMEARGDITLGALTVKVHEEDPYAGYCFQIATGYSGFREDEVEDEFLYQGSVTFAGAITKDGEFSSAPIGIEKKEIYIHQAYDEEGNPVWENEEEQIPWMQEDHYGNMPFTSGETVAAINNTSIKANLFTAYGADAVFAIENKALKAYMPAVRVDIYIEEEDRGYAYNYRTLEEAFANMATDFGSKPGHYTISFLENTKLSKSLTVPSFVTSLRMQADWQWFEHTDEEGNPTIIYDEDGNEIGREGHDESDFATFDLNGFTITSAATIEFVEGLKVVSNVAAKGKIVVNATTGEGYEHYAAVSFNQLTNGCLRDENGYEVNREDGYYWRFIDNVDITASKGVVQLYSEWYFYGLNGNITAKEMNVTGAWELHTATLNVLNVNESWYDENTDRWSATGELYAVDIKLSDGHSYIGGGCFVDNTFALTKTDCHVGGNGGYLYAGNITINAGRLDNDGMVEAGTIKVTAAYANDAFDSTINTRGILKAQTLDMTAGTFNNRGDTAIVEVKNIKDFRNGLLWGGEWIEEDNPETEEVETEYWHEWPYGAMFICDTFNQNSAGKSYLEECSTMIINKSATIYNPHIGEGELGHECSANIFRMPDATVAINGTVTRGADYDYLNVGILSLDNLEDVEYRELASRVDFVELFEEGESIGYWLTFVTEDGEVVYRIEGDYPARDLLRDEVLFTTNSKSFPTDIMWLYQASEEPAYWCAYQSGSEVRVGGDWIHIYAMADNNQQFLASFSLWSEAATYIANLSNPNIKYIIELSDDINVEGNLTLPAKAKAVVLTGTKPPGDPVELTYTGDITLNSELTIGFMDLRAVDKNGNEYHSVVNTKGYALRLFGVDAHFASITGTKGSVLLITSADRPDNVITVDKAVKNIDAIEVDIAELRVGSGLKSTEAALTGIGSLGVFGGKVNAVNGTITIKGDTILSDAEIEAASSITLADVYSLDDLNRITYAGNEKANILTITGNVYGAGEIVEREPYLEAYLGFDGFFGVDAEGNIVAFDAEDAKRIRGGAIDIYVASLDENYTEGAVLLNAPKVSPKWFVVGSVHGEVEDEDGNTGIARTKIGSMTHKVGNQICYGWKPDDADVVLGTWNETVGSFLGYNSYATLQEAFNAIDTIGDANAEYMIQLSADVDMANVATLKTPTKASMIYIVSDGEVARTISYKSELKLNSDIMFQNILLAPQAASNKITMGDHSLYITNGTNAAEGYKIGNITGSGTGKNSLLYVYNTVFEVSGNVENIGKVWIESAEVIVDGKIKVGDIVASVDENIEDGLTPTLVGTATVTRNKTTGKVTKIDPQITIEGTMDYTYGFLAIALQEKVTVDGVTEYVPLDFQAEELSDILPSGIILAKAKNVSSMMITSSVYNHITENEFITTKDNGNIVVRVNDSDFGVLLGYEENGVGVWTRCETIADAVTEINNLKVKRAYTMRILDQHGALTANAPISLKMPASNAIESLTIVSDSGEPVDVHYTGTISFTSDVVLENVNFVQVAKDGNAYVSVNEQKAGYPGIVSVSTGGYDLTIRENVTFNTPIKLDGGRKGNLQTLAGSNFVTLTNGQTNALCGTITGFDTVNFAENMTLSEYGTKSGNNVNYTAPTMNVTTLQMAEDKILVVESSQNKASLTVTNMAYSNSVVRVKGSATITNVTLNGASEVSAVGKLSIKNATLNGTAKIEGLSDYAISGTLTVNTPDAILATVQKSGRTVTPYLNITGKVERSDDSYQIGVAVYDVTGDNFADLAGSPNGTGMLLSAKSATADMFKAAVIDGEDNVDGKAPYSEENQDGYFLMKSGNGIYVYYGNEIGVALCKGDVYDGIVTEDNLIGYYTDFAAAVKALEGLKDKSANYTLVLLKDVNAEKPAALTLPQQAAKVMITSKEGTTKKLHFTGNLTLKTNTEFRNVAFEPVKADGSATTFDISASSYALSLSTIWPSSDPAMQIKNIKGSKQSVSLNNDLVIAGDVTAGYIYMHEDVEIKGNVKSTYSVSIGTNSTLTVGGTFETGQLQVWGNSTLDARKNTVKLNGIYSGATNYVEENTIIYGKNVRTGAPYLTLSGAVNNQSELETPSIVLNFVTGDTMTKADYALTSSGVKVNLNDKQKLAVIEKAPLSNFVMQLNGEDLLPEETVKANKGVYVVGTGTRADKNGVLLEMLSKDDEIYTTYCLDFAQAINEINNVADKEAAYTIRNRGPACVEDVNLTDGNAISAITMPKANVANSLTIALEEGVEFTGNISYAGDLGLYNCDMEVASISNVKTLWLLNSALLTTGTVTVTDVIMVEDATWDAFGKTTITNLTVDSPGSESYLASKQTARTLVPMFTIKGNVRGGSVWKVIKDSAKATDSASGWYVDDYTNVSLVVAEKAPAFMFNAHSFIGEEVISYKDTKNAVKQGSVDAMQVLLVMNGEDYTYAQSFDEAVTFINNLKDQNAEYEIYLLKEGVIKTTKNGTAFGALTLPKAKTAANVTIYGQVDGEGAPTTIIQYTGKLQPNTNVTFQDVILTEGKVSTVNGEQVFTPSYAVTPSLGGNAVCLVFMNNAYTLAATENQEAAVVFTDVSGNKGTVGVAAPRLVEVKGAVNVHSLILDGADMTAAKDVKATNLCMTDTTELQTNGKLTATSVEITQLDSLEGDVVLDAEKAISITDIYAWSFDGSDDEDNLRINTNFTAANSSVSQLEIKGTVTGIEIDIATDLYDAASKTYYPMTAEAATAFFVTDDVKAPSKNQKVATMPKIGSEYVNVLVESEGVWEELTSYNEEAVTLIKHDTGLYMTALPVLLQVLGNKNEEMNYLSSFLSWEQAVKEIDKIGDTESNYVIDVLRNVGQNLDGTLAPIKTLTLPTKVNNVIVTGNNIFFTGTSVSAKCDTAFTEIGLYALKQVKVGRDTRYSSTKYNMNIGNYHVIMQNILACIELFDANDQYLGYFENQLGNLSGSKKGHFEFQRGYSEEIPYTNTPANKITGIGTLTFWDDEYHDSILEDAEDRYYMFTNVPQGISGVDNLIVNPYVWLESWDGAISVKNLVSTGSIVWGKNVTISGTTELESGNVIAGTDIVGDGALKLANIVLQDENSAISAKQDKSGKSAMQITGTVTAGERFEAESTEGALTVELRYNNDSSDAQLYDGMMILTAPKADASWFAPFYTYEYEDVAYDEQGNPIFDEVTGDPVMETKVMPGMGWYREDYGLYKSKNAIYYGSLMAE